MKRILAIDYGRKRVGLAVTDPAQIIANRLTTIATHTIWDFLKDYFQKEKVETVVVGYPKQMNNQASEAVIYINPFLKKFQSIYPKVHLEIIDERFTSKMAFQTMIDGGVGSYDIKGQVFCMRKDLEGNWKIWKWFEVN